MTASVTLVGLVKMRSVSTSVLFLLNQFLLLLICVLNVNNRLGSSFSSLSLELIIVMQWYLSCQLLNLFFCFSDFYSLC